MADALWPYLVVLLAGFLPNEVFRAAAVFIARGVDEASELFIFVRIVAITLLAAVVSKLVYLPPAALEWVPFPVRVGAIALGVAAFFVTGRRLAVGILVGEALLIAVAWVIDLR